MNSNKKSDKHESQDNDEDQDVAEERPRRPPEDDEDDQPQQQHQQQVMLIEENNQNDYVDQNRNLNLIEHEEKNRKMMVVREESDRRDEEELTCSEQITSNGHQNLSSNRRLENSNSPVSSISCNTTTTASESESSGPSTAASSSRQQVGLADHAGQDGHRRAIQFVEGDRWARECSQDDDSTRINMFDINEEEERYEPHAGHDEYFDETNGRQSSGQHCHELAHLLSETDKSQRQIKTATTTTTTTTRILALNDGDDDDDDDPNDYVRLEKIIVHSEMSNQGQQQVEQQQTMGFVGQLERRMSLLPQMLARRMSNQSKQVANDEDRQQQQLVAEPQPLTVAGVGGTITTVTRSKRKTAPLPRLVAKNGNVNLFLNNIDRSQYVRDLFTTMIDIKWRYNLLAAAFGFVFSWIFFACIWYCVLYVHNDLDHENDPNWSPCIVNVHSFPAALLFSIETQSTLGFGSRIISVECPGAIVIFCIQLIFGVVVECLIVGMVFAKLSRPAKRSQTIMYSKFATVCLRQGQMCLMFRVGDVRSKSHIIGATIRASLVSQMVTDEGEIIPFYHHQLNVRIDNSQNSLLLIWPLTIVHPIDETSPFYGLDSEELAQFKFEIITVLEGTVESTGQAIQVRSSYLPSEVRWGYRFEPIVSTHGIGRHAQTIIDYNKFNRVVPVETPNCSPKEYYSRRLQQQTDTDDNRQTSD